MFSEMEDTLHQGLTQRNSAATWDRQGMQVWQSDRAQHVSTKVKKRAHTQSSRHREAPELTWHSSARRECWSRWMTLAKHLLSLSCGEGDKLVRTSRPARQGAQTTHPFGVGSVSLAVCRRMDLPHLVWIDVDPCWKATSASDKSEEAAAILCEGKAKTSANPREM